VKFTAVGTLFFDADDAEILGDLFIDATDADGLINNISALPHLLNNG
jgi:hypothetical protein